MKYKKRDPIKSILLSFLSIGIYYVYWNVNIVKEYLSFTDRKGNIAFEIALAFFCPFLGFYSVEKSFSQSCAKQGIEHTDTSLVYLILSIFPFGVLLALAFMQVELNKITTILEL